MTDAACIDLETFERLPLEQLSFEALPLKPCYDLDILIEELAKGNALPTIAVIEAHNSESDTIGRAYLADLGGWLVLNDSGIPQPKGSLERSLFHLMSCLIDMQQPAVSIDMHRYPLTCLLSSLILNGKSGLTFCLDVTMDGSARSLANGLTLAECLRKEVKSFPVPRLRDPNPSIISQLQEDAEVLHEDKRTALHQVKSLKKQLESIESSRTDLQQKLSRLQLSSQLERFQFEYQLTTMELEAVSLRDAIRECGIKIASAEGAACAQGLQAAELVELNVVKQRQVDLLSGRLKSREEELRTEITTLNGQLTTTACSLQASQAESRRLATDAKSAHERIAQLNQEIAEAAHHQEDIQSKLSADSPVKRAQEREIGTLRRQLEKARTAEEKLNSMLEKSDARAEAHRQVLADLERQMGELKRENEQLQGSTKRDQLANRQPQKQKDESNVGQAIAKMEAEWKAERHAMQQLLDDFKKTALIGQQPPLFIHGKEMPPTLGKKKPPIKNITSNVKKAVEHEEDWEDDEPAKKPTKKSPQRKQKAEKEVKKTKNDGKNSSVPVASILPVPISTSIDDNFAISGPQETAHRQTLLQKPKAPSPVKLWKPASFLPNLSKRPADPENAPLLANLSFADDQRSKRIRLPASKPENPPVPGGNVNQVRSIFRSAAASANPLASDPSLLPSIIANFNVKIPPKK